MGAECCKADTVGSKSHKKHYQTPSQQLPPNSDLEQSFASKVAQEQAQIPCVAKAVDRKLQAPFAVRTTSGIHSMDPHMRPFTTVSLLNGLLFDSNLGMIGQSIEGDILDAGAHIISTLLRAGLQECD
jgi:hypothetical protein